MFVKRYLFTLFLVLLPLLSSADTLDDVMQRGVLRHLAVPYAKFNTGSGDGLDIELMQGFAAWLGVKYEYVPTSWDDALPDLLGAEVVRVADGSAYLGDSRERKGDVLASGVTRLPWREYVVDFSDTTFPSSVWLIAQAQSELKPISPTGSLSTDINSTKQLLAPGLTMLAKPNTCLDASLYDLERSGVAIINTDNSLKVNEMAPAMIHGRSETTLLDVADALIALDKWAGQLKVIGPISGQQEMAAVFQKGDDRFRSKFNQYLGMLIQSGEYRAMIEKYYSNIGLYFPGFFDAL